jgi:hypothetical protein
MTKKEIIEIYGQAYYDAFLIRSREKAKKRYYEQPETRRTKEDQREASARWRAAHPEEAREYQRTLMAKRRASFTLEEREEYLAQSRQRSRDARKRLDTDPEALAAFRARRKATHDAWREANREYVNARSREWAAAHPEYRRAIAIAMARKRRGAGPLDVDFVRWLKAQPCVDCCSTSLIEVGHVIPVRDGGTNYPANLIPQCRPCNRRLSARRHATAPP